MTLALNNTFLLAAFATTTYTTSTIFGNGAPADVPPPPTVPDGGSTLALLGAALGTIGWLRRKVRA